VVAHLSDTFLFGEVLKQGDALLPFLLHFALEYTTGKFQSKPRRKRNCLGHISFCLVCTGAVIFGGKNINIVERNMEA
jgi:hypothetical protein